MTTISACCRPTKSKRDVAQRRSWVAELRRQGLSFRAIGRELGISHELARRDARATLTVVNTPPAQPRTQDATY